MVERNGNNTHILAIALHGEAPVSYTAGIVDGEGTIAIHAYQDRRGSLHLSTLVSVANTEIDMLNFCQDIIGGSVLPVKRKKIKGRSQIYCLRISNMSEVKRALQILLPYLIVKRELAELVIEYIESKEAHRRGHTPHELEIVESVYELNRRW